MESNGMESIRIATDRILIGWSIEGNRFFLLWIKSIMQARENVS